MDKFFSSMKNAIKNDGIFKGGFKKGFIFFKDCEDEKFKAMKRTLGVPAKEDVKKNLTTETEKKIANVLAPDKVPLLFFADKCKSKVLDFIENYDGTLKDFIKNYDGTVKNEN